MRFMKRWLAYLLLVMVLVFGVLFTVQNTATAPLDLFLIQLPEQRVALWLLLSFALGGAIGMLIVMLPLKSRLLLLQRKLSRQERELSKLRSTALSSSQP